SPLSRSLPPSATAPLLPRPPSPATSSARDRVPPREGPARAAPASGCGRGGGRDGARSGGSRRPRGRGGPSLLPRRSSLPLPPRARVYDVAATMAGLATPPRQRVEAMAEGRRRRLPGSLSLFAGPLLPNLLRARAALPLLPPPASPTAPPGARARPAQGHGEPAAALSSRLGALSLAGAGPARGGCRRPAAAWSGRRLRQGDRQRWAVGDRSEGQTGPAHKQIAFRSYCLDIPRVRSVRKRGRRV
ncbi:hypothetical protein PVAP13_9KG384724, partial [Panicum virgatum]